MRIGLDVMGGDFAPEATVAGAVLAHKELEQDNRIVLFGDKNRILAELERNNAYPEQFDIVHCPEVIEMGDSPIRAFSQKTHSSLSIGFKFLKTKKINTFASAGNTGAMLVGTMYSVDSISGVIRPCISTLIPREDGGSNIMLDVGTNPDCKGDLLYQFAILGREYARHVLGIKKPKVGLLNIGTEEKKGNILMQSVHQLMKGSSDFDFIGNIEGEEVFSQKADVIVTDGFTGNIVMKQIEGMYAMLKSRGLSDDFFERMNYENYGGTPILGANAPVIIGHGISSPKAIKNMILLSKDVYNSNMIKHMKRAFRKYKAVNPLK